MTRSLMPDYLRLCALFGIVVVNVQFMAFSVEGGFMTWPDPSMADKAAIFLVNALAYLKTYGLFSFMFGVGLAFQMRSAERRGLAFGLLYRNRMIGLAVLGLLHGVLFFFGDILLTYAIAGSVLYLWRDWPVARLVKTGTGLIAASALLAAAIAQLPEMGDASFTAFERDVMTEGGFVDVLIFRAIGFVIVLAFLIPMQGLAALGWFCLGLAAIRSGMIDDPAHRLWQHARRLCLIPGLVLSAVGAALMLTGQRGWGEAFLALAAPLATLGYLGLIALIAKPVAGAGRLVLRAGGASLTIYLGQSILLSTLFAPYGFGLWGEVGPALAVALALAVTMLLIGMMILWLRVADKGPFERLLHRWTYRGLASKAAS